MVYLSCGVLNLIAKVLTHLSKDPHSIRYNTESWNRSRILRGELLVYETDKHVVVIV